ncbi:hypothetical protein BH10PAT3_BH10PAT3_2650 [soil metagenome]
MPNYQYDVSISRQKKFIRRFKKFLLILIVIVSIAAGIVVFDSVHQNIKSDTQVGKSSTTIYRPTIREFDAPYFTFTSPVSWVNLPGESTEQKFVYQGGTGKMLQQQLDIYINTPPKDLSGTYVLPVRVTDGSNNIIPTEVSDHCNTASALKKASGPVTVKIMGVSMQCQLDSANYIVIVGEKGGDAGIKLKRNDGSTATYYFVYRSSSVPPDTRPLVSIISNFTSL